METRADCEKEPDLVLANSRREGLVEVDALLLVVAHHDGARLELGDGVVGRVGLDIKDPLNRKDTSRARNGDKAPRALCLVHVEMSVHGILPMSCMRRGERLAVGARDEHRLALVREDCSRWFGRRRSSRGARAGRRRLGFAARGTVAASRIVAQLEG